LQSQIGFFGRSLGMSSAAFTLLIAGASADRTAPPVDFSIFHTSLRKGSWVDRPRRPQHGPKRSAGLTWRQPLRCWPGAAWAIVAHDIACAWRLAEAGGLNTLPSLSQGRRSSLVEGERDERLPFPETKVIPARNRRGGRTRYGMHIRGRLMGSVV